MMAGNGQLSVPPGFRFHPTDEELLYYYLRKKVSYEAIDLDVIREVDLNKLEPWDLKDKCRIGPVLRTSGISSATRIKNIRWNANKSSDHSWFLEGKGRDKAIPSAVPRGLA
ncbi:hypothetical protein L1049_022874 [Liquidambar formosana]|uniref:NAC domain-containing protein n=1 Tax=Liquidambar formosana TaxID=63359 RepID=A0AAP0RD52_LIQFO